MRHIWIITITTTHDWTGALLAQAHVCIHHEAFTTAGAAAEFARCTYNQPRLGRSTEVSALRIHGE